MRIVFSQNSKTIPRNDLKFNIRTFKASRKKYLLKNLGNSIQFSSKIKSKL